MLKKRMSDYKVGDVAALFSKPKEPTSESGKKLQALFNEFHNKSKHSTQPYQASEKRGNSLQQESEKIQNLRISKKDKKRKLSAVNGSESNSEDYNSKKFKKADKQERAITVNYKKKQYLAEENFPRKKKSLKTRQSNLNNSLTVKADMSAFTDNKLGSNASNKSKIDRQVSGFIKKSKQQKLPAINISMKSKKKRTKLRKEMLNNDTLLKDGNEEFTKKNNNKTKKKRFRDSNEKNTKFNHTDREDGSESQQGKVIEACNEQTPIHETSFKTEVKDFLRSAKKKSYGAVKVPVEGTPDFIKIPGLKSNDESERLSRTLFIGNLPVNTTRKALRTLFSPFGDVEQIRYHGFENDKAKIFSEDGSKLLTPNNYAADSVPGFIVFFERQSAVNALTLSGSLFEGHHITVDFAIPAGAKKLYDDKRSIFIGNLPFDCKDESVWEAFSGCGRIENVRVVRDKRTGISKGFGYVQFSTVQSKENALALEDLVIQGRSIRIKAVDSNKKKQNKMNSSPVQRDSFKSRAIMMKKKNEDSGSRKSVKKIIKKQKHLHNKKKVANILQKTMKL